MGAVLGGMTASHCAHIDVFTSQFGSAFQIAEDPPLHRLDLLVLDEPTVGVDVAACHAVHAMIRGLADDGVGIPMTYHDLMGAEAICSCVAMLSAGRIARPRLGAAVGRSGLRPLRRRAHRAGGG